MNRSKIRFTIAIISYNVGKYIERAIQSAIEQEFDNFEIIVVDDCSTDNTISKIKRYENERFRILKTERNTGTAGEPRNIAIDSAKGEYIIFLDGDDTIYDNNVLKKIDEIIGKDNPDIVYLGFEDVGQGNKERISTEENSSKKARLLCDLTFSVSSRCWNREFLLNNDMRFKKGIYYEDEIYCLKGTILSKVTKSANLKIFKYYRHREGSVMTEPSIKKCSDWYRMLAEVMDLYKITPDEYKPYLLSFIINENESIPKRIATILQVLESKEEIKQIPQMPKRDYKFRDFYNMKTKIFLVRHTETVGNIEKRLTGRKDYELTDRGKELVSKLTEELKNIKFDKAYVSTSKRTTKTIEPLVNLNKLQIEEIENLSEMYFGIYDGWKWEEVNKVQPEVKINQNKINEIFGIPNQETMEEVAERMYKCIEQIVEENPGKTILICSHGVAIEAFLRKIVNIPFKDKREEFCQYNAAINELEYENGSFKIKQLANIEYLKKGNLDE